MLGKSFARSAVVLSLAFLAACGSDEQAPDAASTGTPPGAERKTATVTPDAGGTLTSADGRLVITFPPGAVPTTTELWVESVPEEKAELDYPDAIPSGVAYRLGPDGRQFMLPAPAVVTLDLAEVPTTADGLPLLLIRTRSAGAGDELLTAATDVDGEPLDPPAAIMEVDSEAARVRVHGDVRHFSDLLLTSQVTTKQSGELFFAFSTTQQDTHAVGDEWTSSLVMANRSSADAELVEALSGVADGCGNVEIVLQGEPCAKKIPNCCEKLPAGVVFPPEGAGELVDPPPRYRCAHPGTGVFQLIARVQVSDGPLATFYAPYKYVHCTGGVGRQGDACIVGSDCESRSCVDLFCCNTSCEGSCQKCSLPGTEGTCSPVPAGEPDDDTCAGMSACSATGECKLGAAEPCTFSTDCASTNCVDGVCCDLACTGTCEACDVSGWVGTCNDVTAGQPDPGTCVSPNACDGVGFCVSPNGAACQTASDCLSGQCVDGVCCDSACAGTCSTCDVAGSEGTCSPLPAGQTDASCSSPDSCDGSGNCQQPAANGAPCQSGGQCQSTHCVDGVCCGSACDLICESCTAANKNSGPDGVCGATKTGEEAGDECAGPNVCAFGECKAPKGAPCAVHSDCVGNMLACRGGVCCDNSFCEPGGGDGCTACLKIWTGLDDGTCGYVLAGQDPYDNCVVPPGSVCNGMSGCQ